MRCPPSPAGSGAQRPSPAPAPGGCRSWRARPLPTRRAGRHSGYAGPSGQSARPRGPSPATQSGTSLRGASPAEKRALLPISGRQGPSALASRSARGGSRARARGFPLPLARARGRRERKREERRGEGRGQERRGEAAAAAAPPPPPPRPASRSAFLLRLPPATPDRGSARFSAPLPPAASGERVGPGPPVTRGGGPSAAPGLGPCRPLSA